jgi:3-deoxy-D-manno-octulosonate 8-phosphate phosphatase (KDO 8-P phosphatase)
MTKILELAKKIQCLICDLDGVLTDGHLYIDNHFNELKTFHIHDGVGLKLLMAAGIEVAVITGSRSAVVDNRMQQLGIKHYYKGRLDKEVIYKQLKETLNLNDDQFAYIGDDIPDMLIMQQVGLGVAVANAVHQVKEIAIWQTECTGGHGAVRELCNLILNAQDKMASAIAGYLKQ